MSKLMYALLGAGALVAVASLASRFVVADTLSGSTSSSSSWSGSSSSSSSSSSCSSSGSGPNCCGAAASLGVIWPPNHKMVPETIVGVTSGRPTTIRVGSIVQDEPVDALGSGNTAPDGSGVGTSIAYVRAERAGPGTGRIYFISFAATDTVGGQCTGIVRVFVPHDQGQGFIPVDTGQRYVSTALGN
jgi:hypothetical protein